MPPPIVRPPRPARTTCLHACAGRSGKRRAWEAGVRDADRVSQFVALSARDASGQLRPVVCEIRMTRASVILRMLRASGGKIVGISAHPRPQPTNQRAARHASHDRLALGVRYGQNGALEVPASIPAGANIQGAQRAFVWLSAGLGNVFTWVASGGARPPTGVPMTQTLTPNA